MNTKLLDLCGLTEAERDARVNIAICETQGWKRFRYRISKSDFLAAPGFKTLFPTIKPQGNEIPIETLEAHYVPPYATSADAVLPLLEKLATYHVIDASLFYADKIPKDYAWRIKIGADDQANGPTFALAACYALLRAHGWEVLM